MKEGRRGFLGKLFKGAAASVAMALPASAVPKETPEPTQVAFRFQCDCGVNITAPVPEANTDIFLKCVECKASYKLHWSGTCWGLRSDAEDKVPYKWEMPAFACGVTEPDVAEAIEELKRKQREP